MLKRSFNVALTSFALLSTLAVPPVVAQTAIENRTRSNEQFVNTTKDLNATFTHHTAEVNGVRLHYVIGGKGEPLVLIHGWPQTWYEWHKVMPALAEKYTVIVPDMRGFGDSSKPVSGYDGRTVAEDIHQLVRKLGFEQIFLVAHDMGSIPAFSYAAAYPNQVRRLVIIELPLPGLGMEEFAQERGIWHFGFNNATDIAETLVKGHEQEFITYMIRNYMYNPEAISDEEIEYYVKKYSMPGAMRAAFGHYRALPETARQNREFAAKQKLSMPVLALGGEASMGDWSLRSLRRAAVNVRGEVIKQSGHFIPEEQPEELVRQLFTFFGEKQ